MVKNEAKIVALPLAVANDIKQQILVYQQTEQSSFESDVQYSHENINEAHDENHIEVVVAEKLLNERSLRDLIIHGLTSNRVFIFLAMLAPMVNTILEKVETFFLTLGLDIKGFLFESFILLFLLFVQASVA